MNTRRWFLTMVVKVLGLSSWLPGARSNIKTYRQGMIRVSPEDRRKGGMLLPPNTEILGISPHVWFHGNDWGMKVEHSALPATPIASALPEVQALFHEDGSFDRWGIVGSIVGRS